MCVCVGGGGGNEKETDGPTRISTRTSISLPLSRELIITHVTRDWIGLRDFQVLGFLVFFWGSRLQRKKLSLPAPPPPFYLHLPKAGWRPPIHFGTRVKKMKRNFGGKIIFLRKERGGNASSFHAERCFFSVRHQFAISSFPPTF